MSDTYKILYCIPSLTSAGGMEKVVIAKANYFADILNYEVSIFISDQKDKPIAFKLSKKVKVLNLEISKYTFNSIKGFSFFKNIIILKKRYAVEIERLNPDVIIVAERGYEDFIIPKICKHIPKIREYHFSKKASSMLEKELPVLKRLKNNFIKNLYFNQFKRYDAFVVLTLKDQKEWSSIKNSIVIPNYIEPNNYKKNDILKRPNKVISVGSMQNDRKGFSSLIAIWDDVVKAHSDWTLHIYGDGVYRPTLQNVIDKRNLQNTVFLEGVSNKIHEKYQESQLFLFASKGEGFGMVIVEAQQNGLPIVAYDCFCGPSDILSNDKGGFLIPMDDSKTFIKNIKKLLNDTNLRKLKSDQAYINAQRYNQEKIMPHWVNLFNKLVKK